MKTGTRLILVTVVAVLFSSPPLLAQSRSEGSTRAERLSRLLERVWWNDPDKVSQLDLDDEQRSRMDTLLVEYHKSLGKKKPLRRIRSEFNNAIANGSWDEARRLSAELGDEIERNTVLKNELKIDVMGIMTDEQRERFASEYPRLLRHSWPKTKPSRSAATVNTRGAGQFQENEPNAPGNAPESGPGP